MSHTGRFEIKGPEHGSLRPKPQRGEILEASGDLELSCSVCYAGIGSQETVEVFSVGEFFAAAHIDCVSRRGGL